MLSKNLSKYRIVEFALLVAIVATSGSLYLSIGLGLTPCHLCWWQRIFMYPLVLILGVSRIYRVDKVTFYVLPMSILGLGVSLYHSYLQLTSDALCGTGGCSAILFKLFGLFSIPNLASIAFSLITASMVAYLLKERK